MTAIVLNTATGAISEYDWSFESITAARAGSANGLFTLGGATDAGTPISAQLLTGKPENENGKLMTLGNTYVTLSGSGAGFLIVAGKSSSWEYAVAVRGSGIGRAKPGRGIRESRLAFGYRNAEGADFRLDRLDVEIAETTTRRV